jgi:hypothetical protein
MLPVWGGGTVVVTTEGKLVYALPAGEEKPLHTGVSLNALREERQPLRQGVTLSEELVGGHIATIKGEEPAVTKVNTLHGQNPTHWKRGIPTYQRVNLGEIYEGVEVKLAVQGGSVEKLFFIKAGAKPEHIRMRMRGGLWRT